MNTLSDEHPEDFVELVRCRCGARGPAKDLEDGCCPICGHDLTEDEDYEPPEGEAFRGGEAAAFRQERQAQIQRELKR